MHFLLCYLVPGGLHFYFTTVIDASWAGDGGILLIVVHLFFSHDGQNQIVTPGEVG